MARRKVVAEPKTEKAKRRKAKGEIVPVPAVVAVAVETFPDGGPVPVQGEPGRGPWSVTIVAAEPVVVAPAGPLLYLPDDEPEACTFNSHVFTLQPNQTTEIVSPWKEIKADEIARFILDRLERWGVVRVTGPVKDCVATVPADQAAVDAAEARYLISTLAWAQNIVIEHGRAVAPLQTAGLPTARESDAVVKARAWLEKYAPKLFEAGLIVSAAGLSA